LRVTANRLRRSNFPFVFRPSRGREKREHVAIDLDVQGPAMQDPFDSFPLSARDLPVVIALVWLVGLIVLAT
jgi:hypothetical protein